MPVIEAMAFLLPIVAAPLTAVPRVAGETALYAPANSPAEILSRLQDILQNAPREERLKRASALQGRTFRWSVVAPRLQSLYKKEDWTT